MGVRSVGIDLSLQGAHRVEALDEFGNQCGHLSFRTDPKGLDALSQVCAQSGSSLTVVMEPTGLARLPAPRAGRVKINLGKRKPVFHGVS